MQISVSQQTHNIKQRYYYVKTTLQRRFGVIMTFLRYVSAGLRMDRK